MHRCAEHLGAQVCTANYHNALDDDCVGKEQKVLKMIFLRTIFSCYFQVYILTTKNLERLLSKRNTTTLESLRSTVEWKLTRRLGAGGSTGRHTVHQVPTPRTPAPGAAGVPGVVGPTSSLASFYSVSALLDEGLPVPMIGRLLYRLRRPPEPAVEVKFMSVI